MRVWAFWSGYRYESGDIVSLHKERSNALGAAHAHMNRCDEVAKGANVFCVAKCDDPETERWDRDDQIVMVYPIEVQP